MDTNWEENFKRQVKNHLADLSEDDEGDGRDRVYHGAKPGA